MKIHHNFFTISHLDATRRGGIIILGVSTHRLRVLTKRGVMNYERRKND